MYNGDQAQDEYSDTLPNGQVWAGVVTVLYGPGVALQDFDPTTNTVSSVTPPPDKGNPYPIDYVNLPNGQVMVTASDQDWIYTPDTLPNDAWRPTVTSVTFNSGTTYTLTGTQLSGLINGADEGDDMTMAENYPIVWLTDAANNVYYCRSFNFSNMMPSNGSAAETTQFTTPAGLAAGTYNLFVSAVGVQSKVAFSFTTGARGAPDSGAEAATMATDAGTASDATGATEAGATTDASAGSGDGGVASEAGVAAEAGAPAEAGVNDGGGNTVDNGAPSGCGCRTAGNPSRARDSAALLGLLGIVTAARRRRRRN
jgi:MYXO-CTERM domain-containing protein